jgi:hypothetical protein
MRHVAVDCLFEQITRATACASNVGTFGGGVTHVGCLDGLPAGLRAAKSVRRGGLTAAKRKSD